jgi:regulator of sirC expression with transglutaminase-like and TPR domain
MNWILFVEERFRGNEDEYYDPRNSYLDQVLFRKLGIPISLSILYLAVAERIGLAMSGVNLPAHFVVRTGLGSSTLFVDPFHAGALMDRQGCERRVAELTGQNVALPDSAFAACDAATLVTRMLRNLKASYLRESDFSAVLPVLRRLSALTNDPAERRDLGMACLQAEKPGEAIDHLSHYLNVRPRADDAEDVTAMLRVARSGVATRN